MRFILTTEISWKPNTFIRVYFKYPSALLSLWCRHSRIDFIGNNYMVYLTILCCSLYWILVKNSIIVNNSFLFGFWPRCSIYIFKLVPKMCEIGYLNPPQSLDYLNDLRYFQRVLLYRQKFWLRWKASEIVPVCHKANTVHAIMLLAVSIQPTS